MNFLEGARLIRKSESGDVVAVLLQWIDGLGAFFVGFHNMDKDFYVSPVSHDPTDSSNSLSSLDLRITLQE